MWKTELKSGKIRETETNPSLVAISAFGYRNVKYYTSVRPGARAAGIVNIGSMS